MRLNMCTGAEGNQAHHRDSNGPRVQKQPLFLVCSIIDILIAAMQTYLLCTMQEKSWALIDKNTLFVV